MDLPAAKLGSGLTRLILSDKEVQSPLVASDPPAAFPVPAEMVVHRQVSADAMTSNVLGAINRPRMSERSSTSTSSDVRRSSPTGSVASSQSQIVTPSRQLSDGEKLKKCISELVETERTYVKVSDAHTINRIR